MPRRTASANNSEPKANQEAEPPQNVSYLDSFLSKVTENVDLPHQIKKALSQLKDYDQHAHELFERSQKLSKTYVTRAKRALQQNHELDEESLHKARKLHRELLEIDNEKVNITTAAHTSICTYLEQIETELARFEAELLEKGQLKAPIATIRKESSLPAMPSLLSSSLSSKSLLDSNPLDLLDKRSARSSPVVRDEFSDVSSVFSASHKRSVRSGEQKRQSRRPHSTEDSAASVAGYSGFGFKNNLDLMVVNEELSGESSTAPSRPEYPDAALPLASKDESMKPLCGAMPAASDMLIPDKAKVAARPSPQADWILAMVVRHHALSNKYVILDLDADSSGDPTTSKQHTVPAKSVMPLPTSEPLAYTPYNEFQRGITVLAMYPDTTCFYRAFVHTPPSQNTPNDEQRRDYLVEFEDENEASGRSEAMRVPQKYVLRLPEGT